LLYRLQTKGFKAANPSCQLAINCSSAVTEPTIEITLSTLRISLRNSFISVEDSNTAAYKTQNMTAADVIVRVSKLVKRIEE